MVVPGWSATGAVATAMDAQPPAPVQVPVGHTHNVAGLRCAVILVTGRHVVERSLVTLRIQTGLQARFITIRAILITAKQVDAAGLLTLRQLVTTGVLHASGVLAGIVLNAAAQDVQQQDGNAALAGVTG
jgi:hypothetical protein